MPTYTGAWVIDQARYVLADRQAPYRYTDAQLVSALGTEYQALKIARPQLFLGRFVEDAATPMTIGSDLSHLSEVSLMMLADAVASRALLTDDDIVGDGGKMTITAKTARRA